MKYRPEIDGLRSFAVIPVVLFHAGFTSFSGGFVGVDVFFVISGFLIANIIIAEISAGSFTYSGFYERRVRRIMPALLTVVLVSILASFIFSLPNQVEQAAWSGIFAIFGISNIYFWTQSGYFAPASDFQMLLHTWSLGVEEQFYLLLPPVLFLILRFKINLRLVMLAALPLLFVAGLWLSLNKPSVAFFLLPARAWELALGVALAAGVLPRWDSARGNSIIALLGLSAIIASVFVIDKQMAFPGWAALLPCLGAATVIYAASDNNLVGRLLAIAPLRFIGLISYSLYLWHWPVFVALRMYSAEAHLDLSLAIFGVALSVLLAYLTWRFVENPFRARQVIPFRKVCVGLGSVSLLAMGVSVFAIVSSGLPNRLSPTAERFAAAAQDIDPVRIRCQGMRDINDQDCWFGNPEAEPSFIVVGDSHAGAIRPAIEQWAASNGLAGTILWQGGCPLMVGATKVPDADGAICTEFKAEVQDAIIANTDIELVIVVGRWEAMYTGIAPEVGGSYRTFWIDEEEFERTPEVTNRVFERGLRRTAQTFTDAGRTVVFIGAVPEVGFDVPTILALSALNQNVQTSMDLARDNSTAVELDGVFQEVAREGEEVGYVSIWEQFCGPQCKILLNGVPLYSDDDHLSLTAARDFIGPYLTVALNDALASQR